MTGKKVFWPVKSLVFDTLFFLAFVYSFSEFGLRIKLLAPLFPFFLYIFLWRIDNNRVIVQDGFVSGPSFTGFSRDKVPAAKIKISEHSAMWLGIDRKYMILQSPDGKILRFFYSQFLKSQINEIKQLLGQRQAA